MSSDSAWREFEAVMRRPASVSDWGQVSDLLAKQGDGLLEGLGPGWDSEGPLREASQPAMILTRKVTEQLEHVVSIALNPAREGGKPAAAPDELRFRVQVSEQPLFAKDLQLAENRRANLVIAFALVSSVAAAYGVWRATRGLFAAGVAFVCAFIALLVADLKLSRWLRGRRTSHEPSAEFLALAANVEGFLRRPESGFSSVSQLTQPSG